MRMTTTSQDFKDGSFSIGVDGEGSYDITVSKHLTEEEQHLLIRELIEKDFNERQRTRIRDLRSRLDEMDAWSRLVAEAKKEERRPDPPAWAEAAFSLLAPKGTADAQLGDLQEIFLNNVNRFGHARASRLYWSEVAKAVWPALLRIAKKVGVYSLIVDYIRTKFGL